jgi:wyosine [tRNA(Phe)-imidazoG37] synthetase (radical SAM superfamily)
MFDINFYRKVDEIKTRLDNGEKFSKEWLLQKLEEFRSKEPIVYNIETTNACNMRCIMCPRTTMMTRKIETISPDLFIKVVKQIKPHTKSDWAEWEKFVQKRYGIPPDAMGENHFFLYVIPKVIQLHGYGEPLLDKNMPEYIRMLNERGFESYFSCNPANARIGQTVKMFENGLNYIKYSIESVDDFIHKKIRGKASNFTGAYKKILRLLEIKAQKNYKTVIVITMLDLHRDNQLEEWERLKDAFRGYDVYIYFKSEDTQWLRQDYHGTCSIHWSEFCKHPWMSMTIKSNGEATMCMEDYNNAIILGDASKESLYDIWNGEKYAKFRKDHFDLTKGIQCTERCDMKLIGQYCQ